MLRNPNGLSYAVVSLLGATAVVDVFAFLAALALRADPVPEGSADLIVALVSVVQLLLLVATVVVWIVWFHRTRQNAQVWAPDLHSRGPGWAIGAWFIPFANLWIPRNIAAEIWRASRRLPYAPDAPGELGLLNGWWALFVLQGLVDRVAGRLYEKAETPDAYVTAASWLAANDIANIAAAVLAILFVRRLTSMQHAKATGMIPAAQ
ncbi:DUF4328 domain-containing protein [Streptomyces sp. NPDC053493]|uniref:DUF4328 domain-containing protein n=1 Tax=Streptomyces sp. NPDC053493 TaxID=3365705 RepID=UPI0037D054CB